MAIGELILGLLALDALSSKGSATDATKPAEPPPPAPPQRDQRDQAAELAKTGFEVAGSLVGIGSLLLGGGGTSLAGTAGAASAGATTGAVSGGTGGTSALSAAWTSVIGPLVAIVIVVVWLTAMTALTVGMVEAANRRAYRQIQGWPRVRKQYEAQIAKQTEKNAMTLIDAIAGSSYQTRWNDGLQWGPGLGFFEITPGTVALGPAQTAKGPVTQPAGTLTAIGTLVRLLAIEQVRALNDTVLSFFTVEVGFTEEQVENNGDALQRGRFEALVADYYVNHPTWAGQFLGNPDGTLQVWSQALATVTAQGATAKLLIGAAHFSGKQAGLAYVNGALALLSLFSPGPQPVDAMNAANCFPQTSDHLAWLNRVFDLREEIQAGVFYDDEAQLAWMPDQSGPIGAGGAPSGPPKFFPYSTKNNLKDWTVGR